jgi:membrane protein YdbS with pleckstrin-like domain
MRDSQSRRGPAIGDDVVRWKAYPSWGQFTWLYLFSLMAALRGGLFLWFGVGGWEMWVAGAVLLLLCAAVMRRWACYMLTSRRIVVRNGYTGREIQAVELDQICEVSINQGPIAQFLGIGTLVIRPAIGDRILSLRGIRDPEVIKAKIDAVSSK